MFVQEGTTRHSPRLLLSVALGLQMNKSQQQQPAALRDICCGGTINAQWLLNGLAKSQWLKAKSHWARHDAKGEFISIMIHKTCNYLVS